MPSTQSQRSVLFVAGDLSGDRHMERLVRKYADKHPGDRLLALGGQALGRAVQERGGTWIGDTTGCSAIGLCSVAKIYAWARWLSFKMRRHVRKHPVDAVVLCDWGGFNCRQLNFFRKQKVPVLYFFPPSSWRRQGTTGLAFAAKVDSIATPFRWSAERLKAVGARAEWVGHPVLEFAGECKSRDELREEFGIADDERMVAMLPGSRHSEVRVLGKTLAAAAEVLKRRCEKLRFFVPVPSAMYGKARRLFPPDIGVIEGRAYEVLTACDAAVVKTGSATMEAVAAGAPMVAVYDLGWAARFEWLLLYTWKHIPFIAMPNIILEEELVRELLGLRCTPGLIAAEVEKILFEPGERDRLMAGYGIIREHLGGNMHPGPTEKTLCLLEEVLERNGKPAVP